MLCRLVVVLALSGADALNLGAAASRRSFIAKAAAAAGSLAVAAPVFAEAPDLNLIGKAAMGGNREKYQAGGFDVKKAASNPQFGPGGKNPVKNPFDNKFSDPAHSDLTRKISWIGGRDYQIDGADEDAKKWVVIAKRKNANTLIADFSSKGGPEGVVVTAKTNGDLSFPDGNVWKKL